MPELARFLHALRYLTQRNKEMSFMYSPVFPSVKTNAFFFFETETRKKDKKAATFMMTLSVIGIFLFAGFTPL